MQLQDYAEPIARTQKWRTTEAGLTISGAKTARLTREAVEQALSALRDRIQAINNDKSAEYVRSRGVWRVSLAGRTSSPAEVGIRLTPRKGESEAGMAVEHKPEEAFLKQLRGRSAALHIQDYEAWMSARSHRTLL